MKFKDLNLKVGDKLLWKPLRPDSVYDFWIGEVVKILRSHFSIMWIQISGTWEQTVSYSLNTKVYSQIVYDDPELIEYLNLFKCERVQL